METVLGRPLQPLPRTLNVRSRILSLSWVSGHLGASAGAPAVGPGNNCAAAAWDSDIQGLGAGVKVAVILAATGVNPIGARLALRRGEGYLDDPSRRMEKFVPFVDDEAGLVKRPGGPLTGDHQLQLAAQPGHDSRHHRGPSLPAGGPAAPPTPDHACSGSDP